MIGIIGTVAYDEQAGGRPGAGGLAAAIAAAAARHGRKVELIGKVGEDAAGDSVVLALAEARIGHAALLRDASRPTPVCVTRDTPDGEPVTEMLPAPAERPILDRGDVELALRYLPDLHVVVATDGMADEGVVAAAQGAAFAGARLVVIVPADAAGVGAGGESGAAAGGRGARSAREGLPPEAIVLEAPDQDDGAFVQVVASFAAGLDAMKDPAAALREAVASSGWERVGE